MHFFWLLATLTLLTVTHVQAQVPKPQNPDDKGTGATAGTMNNLSGIWNIYGWACKDGQPVEARAEIQHTDKLIAVIMMDDCLEHAYSADKVYMTGYVDQEKGLILFQKVDYHHQGGIPIGSRLRGGHIFQDGRIILLQENNWRDRYFMVRADD